MCVKAQVLMVVMVFTSKLESYWLDGREHLGMQMTDYISFYLEVSRM